MSIRPIPSILVSRLAAVFLVLAVSVALAPALLAACGNGVVEAGEDCDDGGSNGGFHSCCSNTCKFNGNSPDVIVGDIMTPARYGTSGGITGYAIGTTSCNIGTCWLNWFSSINEHPVIGQTMYRLKDGRFEQIGQSWLKHGFTALNEHICSAACPSGAGGSHLGVNCSDPYTASLNGDQNRLGPKWEVNPSTGVYTYPFTNPPGGGSGPIYKRLQVHNEDLDPTLNVGAKYWLEGQYVTHDDATAKNQNNNASYRRITVGSSPYDLALQGSTQRGNPAIKAWKVEDPSVVETVFGGGEGTWNLSAKATSLGNGVYHYEYALHNLNANRAGQSVSIPIPAGAVVTNIGFHDVDYHSGEPFVGTDWTGTVAGGSITWASQTFAENVNANALRWGTLYNFRFDTNRPPATGNLTLVFFKPGTGTSTTTSTVVPGTCAASESVCGNGLDDDCDGQSDCTDTDCCTSVTCAGLDTDGDGFGPSCDCNNANGSVYPGAPQICDGVNNNCLAAGWPAVPVDDQDADGDGLRACAGDCDDSNPSVYPGALQLCDGVNDNCSDPTWPAVLPIELDSDADGVRGCGGDCDDANPARFPDNPEVCDGIDNDCLDGVPANELDVDGDGVPVCGGDCDDADLARYPGNPEACDGIDNDCADGVPASELDTDGDGVRACGGDCDDAEPARYPGNPEVCDGLDNDCAGGLPPDEVDGDGNGQIDCQTDCDTNNVAVWAIPGEVHDLMLAQAEGVTNLSWSAPTYPGGTVTRYDTLRSQVASDFMTGSDCVEADGIDLASVDADAPELDQVRFYLIRAENDCPGGEGSLGQGFDPAPAPRLGRLCP